MFDKFKTQYSTIFEFLKSEYGFGRRKIKISEFSCYIWHKNRTTGIRCGYEAREGLITLLFYRLINDTFPPYETNIDENTMINSFYLGDIIANKTSDDEFWIDQTNLLKNTLEEILNNLAGASKKYADEILRGDFSSFPELEKIVKERWRNSR